VDVGSAHLARRADGAMYLNLESASHGRACVLVVAFPHAGAARDFHAWAAGMLRGGAGWIRPSKPVGASRSFASTSDGSPTSVEEGEWGASVAVNDDEVTWAEWSRSSARLVAHALSRSCAWAKSRGDRPVPPPTVPPPSRGVADPQRGISWSPPPGWEVASWKVEGADEPFAVARRGRAEVYLAVLDACASLPGLREFAKRRFGIHGSEAFEQTLAGSWRGLVARGGLPDGLADLRLFTDGVRVFLVSVRAPSGEVPDDVALRRLLEGVRSTPRY
jgi:hypothetical protein